MQQDLIGLCEQIIWRCGDLATFQAGPLTNVVLNTPELAHDVLVTQAVLFEKPFGLRNYTQEVFGNGLVTSLNSFHTRQRKLVAPALQHRRVIGYADVMAKDAEYIQAQWADGETVEMGFEMMRLTFWIVGKTLFDVEGLELAARLDKQMLRANRYAKRRAMSVAPLPLCVPTLRNLRDRAALGDLDRELYKIIADHRETGHDRGDLLSMLLAARDADDGSFMTDRQVRDEAITLFGAGHETTANGLTWTWYLLSQPRHRHIYDRMLAEIDAALGGRTPTYADLKALPYTLQVFKESMRLYPLVPTVAREAAEPVVVGGYQFKKGTMFIINPYTLHRHPRIWPNPTVFDPNRFADGAEARLPKSAYIPFVNGPRNCIGNQFALMEGHIVLAALAQRVTFEYVQGQRIERAANITMRPKYGLKLIVHRRP